MVCTVGEPLAAVPVLERLLRRYLDGEYTAISAAAMAQVVSALLYFVSPWDLYPDSVPGKGYADDAAVLDCCWKLWPAGTGGLSCLGERTAGLPERIGWGVKIRTGGDFPMKRKTLIRAAALALTAALLFTGCTARTPEENPESSGQLPEQYGRTGKG